LRGWSHGTTQQVFHRQSSSRRSIVSRKSQLKCRYSREQVSGEAGRFRDSVLGAEGHGRNVMAQTPIFSEDKSLAYTSVVAGLASLSDASKFNSAYMLDAHVRFKGTVSLTS